MEFLILVVILIIIGCSKIRTDTAINKSNKEASIKGEKRNKWHEDVYDSFLADDLRRYIRDSQNANEIEKLWCELSRVAPELKNLNLVIYPDQLDDSFTKKEKAEIIYNNVSFLLPFLMAKHGKVNDYLGQTYPQDIILNQGTSWQIKRTNNSPRGLSWESIVGLNKWLERTLRTNGVPKARVIYAKTYAGNRFYWDIPCPSLGEYLW